jgi:hypothetical protein
VTIFFGARGCEIFGAWERQPILSQRALVKARDSLEIRSPKSLKSQINHSEFHKASLPPSKGWQEPGATLHATTGLKGFAMSFTMKLSLMIYAFIMGVIALGLNGQFPH